jgi:hypothetical protein
MNNTKEGREEGIKEGRSIECRQKNHPLLKKKGGGGMREERVGQINKPNKTKQNKTIQNKGRKDGGSIECHGKDEGSIIKDEDERRESDEQNKQRKEEASNGDKKMRV